MSISLKAERTREGNLRVTVVTLPELRVQGELFIPTENKPIFCDCGCPRIIRGHTRINYMVRVTTWRSPTEQVGVETRRFWAFATEACFQWWLKQPKPEGFCDVVYEEDMLFPEQWRPPVNGRCTIAIRRHPADPEKHAITTMAKYGCGEDQHFRFLDQWQTDNLEDVNQWWAHGVQSTSEEVAA